MSSIVELGGRTARFGPEAAQNGNWIAGRPERKRCERRAGARSARGHPPGWAAVPALRRRRRGDAGGAGHATGGLRVRPVAAAPSLRPAHRRLGPRVAGSQRASEHDDDRRGGATMPAVPRWSGAAWAVRARCVREPLPVDVATRPRPGRVDTRTRGLLARPLPRGRLHRRARRAPRRPVAATVRRRRRRVARADRGAVGRRLRLRDGVREPRQRRRGHASPPARPALRLRPPAAGDGDEARQPRTASPYPRDVPRLPAGGRGSRQRAGDPRQRALRGRRPVRRRGGRSRSRSGPGATASAGSATSTTTPPSISCAPSPTSSAATTGCGDSRCRT